jgi:6-hydroxycyclohex-1-ene-1-carbonyl-CoA dehydrogenase
MAENEYMLSRFMAFDAEIIGTWRCLPEYYPIVLDMVLNKRIDIGPFVETRPMSEIQSVFESFIKQVLRQRGSSSRRISKNNKKEVLSC